MFVNWWVWLDSRIR